MSRKYPQVYLDFTIGTTPAGRVTFELFTDLTPKTSENFRGLCTGDYGNVGMGTRTKRLHYLNTPIHRVVDGFAIQGGDIIKGDGTSGASIYGNTFADENFDRKHACAGLLSMANRGRNTNSSQFFITLKPSPHLDGKHVVFGQVIDGMEVVRKIAKVPVDGNDKPKIPINIVGCGEVNDAKSFLRHDPFQKSIIDEMDVRKQEIKKAQQEFIRLSREGGKEEENQENKRYCIDNLDVETNNIKVEEMGEENVVEGDHVIPVSVRLGQDKLSRLQEIKMRLNEARKMNNQAVLEEERMMNDPNYEKAKRAKKWQEKKKEIEEENEFKGIDEDKTYLSCPAIKAEAMTSQQKKKNETFGWDVFNEDSLYNAYKKRVKTMSHYKEVYDKQKENPNEDIPISEERLQKLVDDLQAQEEKRKKFSRRRTFYGDSDIDYINDRNRVFNKKLDRAFGKYAADIKFNMETGTAFN